MGEGVSWVDIPPYESFARPGDVGLEEVDDEPFSCSRAALVRPGCFSPLISESGGGKGKWCPFSKFEVIPLTELGVRAVEGVPASFLLAASRFRLWLNRRAKPFICGGLSELSGPSPSVWAASAADADGVEVDSDMAIVGMNVVMVVE